MWQMKEGRYIRSVSHMEEILRNRRFYRMQLPSEAEVCWDIFNERNRPDGISQKYDGVRNNSQRADYLISTMIKLRKHHRKSRFSSKIRLWRTINYRN